MSKKLQKLELNEFKSKKKNQIIKIKSLHDKFRNSLTKQSRFKNQRIKANNKFTKSGKRERERAHQKLERDRSCRERESEEKTLKRRRMNEKKRDDD